MSSVRNSPAGTGSGDADSDDGDDKANYEDGHGQSSVEGGKRSVLPATRIKQTPCCLYAVVVGESLSAVQLF